MVQSVLGSLVLGYRPLWNAARKLAGVQLYVHGHGSQRVDAARQNGFAVAHGTLEADTVGVAAPFFDASGRVIGAVAVAGLSSRMDGEAIARAGALVCAAAKQVTRQLGGRSGA